MVAGRSRSGAVITFTSRVPFPSAIPASPTGLSRSSPYAPVPDLRAIVTVDHLVRFGRAMVTVPASGRAAKDRSASAQPGGQTMAVPLGGGIVTVADAEPGWCRFTVLLPLRDSSDVEPGR